MTKNAARKRSFPELFFLCLLLFFFLVAQRAAGQANYWPDSLKRELTHATDVREKIRLSMGLAQYYFGQNRPLSDDYGRQAVEMAELSRDRMLMIRTYLINGKRFLSNNGLRENLGLAMENFRRAEQIAKAEKLDDGLVFSDCALADGYRSLGDNEQALTYSNQAVTTASDGANDSVLVLAYTSLGQSYEAKNEKLLAFRNYLKALDIAEEGKKVVLTRNVSAYLSFFYDNILEYDKAIDYEVRVVGIDRQLHHYYELRSDYNNLARLFTKKKEYDIALGLSEHAIALADSIHFDLVKIDSYFDIFDMYFKAAQYQKGMAYLGLHPEVMDYIDRAGLHYIVDGMYGSAYQQMGRFDSAAYFFNRAEAQVASRADILTQADFYDQAGGFYKMTGMPARAISYYLKEQDIGRTTGDLQILQRCALSLDSAYLKTGDYRTAYTYTTAYALYSDSLRNLTKETDLLKLEVDSDNRRRERQVKEEEQDREHRHNVQYMGLTVGLVVLFIALVMLGWLAVPPSVIRALGFLSFIFLFEFIILLADRTIQAWTHEEPWKVLLIKIGLAAILVPLHHWLEHKVIHYLSSRRRFSGERRPAAGSQGEAGGAEGG
jgi:tetratricopeptide (TPR) repeat protein